jgi:hypothetical protein
LNKERLNREQNLEFAGRTGNGDWADCLAEMDYRTGQILDAIKEAGIEHGGAGAGLYIGAPTNFAGGLPAASLRGFTRRACRLHERQFPSNRYDKEKPPAVSCRGFSECFKSFGIRSYAERERSGTQCSGP